MLSLQTSIELVQVVNGYVERIVDDIFAVFDLEHLVHPLNGRFNKDQKLRILLKELKYRSKPGPFSQSIKMDVLQYMVTHFYRGIDDNTTRQSYQELSIPYDDKFSASHPSLAYSLKRDGYVVKGRVVTKMLPEQIVQAKTETELDHLLAKYNFETTHGHLRQAVMNHSQGNWSGANSQFRPFFESLLIDITFRLSPNEPAKSGANAILILSTRVTPPFFSASLNEIEHGGCKKPFIEGLWKRLHPAGPHPGLSDEDDCTFRYHTLIVTAHYLLKRLDQII